MSVSINKLSAVLLAGNSADRISSRTGRGTKRLNKAKARVLRELDEISDYSAPAPTIVDSRKLREAVLRPILKRAPSIGNVSSISIKSNAAAKSVKFMSDSLYYTSQDDRGVGVLAETADGASDKENVIRSSMIDLTSAITHDLPSQDTNLNLHTAAAYERATTAPTPPQSAVYTLEECKSCETDLRTPLCENQSTPVASKAVTPTKDLSVTFAEATAKQDDSPTDPSGYAIANVPKHQSQQTSPPVKPIPHLALVQMSSFSASPDARVTADATTQFVVTSHDVDMQFPSPDKRNAFTAMSAPQAPKPIQLQQQALLSIDREPLPQIDAAPPSKPLVQPPLPSVGKWKKATTAKAHTQPITTGSRIKSQPLSVPSMTTFSAPYAAPLPYGPYVNPPAAYMNGYPPFAGGGMYAPMMLPYTYPSVFPVMYPPYAPPQHAAFPAASMAGYTQPAPQSVSSSSAITPLDSYQANSSPPSDDSLHTSDCDVSLTSTAQQLLELQSHFQRILNVRPDEASDPDDTPVTIPSSVAETAAVPTTNTPVVTPPRDARTFDVEYDWLDYDQMSTPSAEVESTHTAPALSALRETSVRLSDVSTVRTDPSVASTLSGMKRRRSISSRLVDTTGLDELHFNSALCLLTMVGAGGMCAPEFCANSDQLLHRRCEHVQVEPEEATA